MYDIGFFEEELNLFENADFRKLTEAALNDAPAYFWSFTATWTGKYHSPDDNVEGGLCHHTAKVVWHAHKFFEAFGHDTDIAVAAGLLHDIQKYGPYDEPKVNFYKQHAVLAYDFANLHKPETEAADDQLNAKWSTMAWCIRAHMGKWGDIEPESMQEILFHLADVAASSKNFVALKFYDREAAPKTLETAEFQHMLTDADGALIVNFGKYKGEHLSDVVADMGFVNWLLQQTFPDEVKEAFREARKAWVDRIRNGTADSLPDTIPF